MAFIPAIADRDRLLGVRAEGNDVMTCATIHQPRDGHRRGARRDPGACVGGSPGLDEAGAVMTDPAKLRAENEALRRVLRAELRRRYPHWTAASIYEHIEWLRERAMTREARFVNDTCADTPGEAT